MSEEPIIDVANVFGVGQIGRIVGLEDAILLEPLLREVTPAQRAARETAESVRRLVRELETTSASIEDLGSVASQLDELSESLARGNHDSETAGDRPNAAYQAHRLRERSPFIGRANPVALPLIVEFVDGGVDAVANFGTLYEGPPG
jgi:hypothetical protein